MPPARSDARTTHPQAPRRRPSLSLETPPPPASPLPARVLKQAMAPPPSVAALPVKTAPFKRAVHATRASAPPKPLWHSLPEKAESETSRAQVGPDVMVV